MRVLILLFLSAPAHAGFFFHHVKESIQINQNIRTQYRELTAGRSDKAFKKLIFLERAMLPATLIYDARASWYQRRGVSVLNQEFLSMNDVPELENTGMSHPEIKNIPWQNYKRELKVLIEKRNQSQLLKRSLEMVQELKAQPAYWCLTRHLVESVYRFAYFLPERIREAEEKKIKSPAGLIWEIMDFHLLGFHEFEKIDRLSAPMQQEGIPLICNELPDLIHDLPR